MSAEANNNRKRIRNREAGRNTGRISLSVIGGSLLLVIVFLYLLTALYYKSHFYGNTRINGINAANMTVSKAEAAIDSKVQSYQLTLQERNHLTDTIKGKAIGLHTEFNGAVSKLLDQQNPFAWPVFMFQSRKYEIKTMLEYDDTLLKQRFKNLKCFDEANNKNPVNASISEYGENGYEIVPENPGAKVKEDKLYDAVSKAVNELKTSLSVEKEDCYEIPEVTSKSPELVAALKEMNKIAGAKITYKFGDKTETVDGTRISKWISVDDQFHVTFQEDGIKEFVDYIGRTYNSFGRIRTFKTSYGKTLKIKGGDYGWWLNRPKEVKELTELIKAGKQETKKPVYFQTAQQYGEDDIGNTYVEVNLTAQHLYFYYKGKKILDTDVVTGDVSKNFGTPVGTYPIQYKERDATLVGENYSTPVKYWMPFNKNIGCHDANWRHGLFGGKHYLTNGSHGCVNMPPDMAKKMFQYIQRGVAVVVYELPGTETYDTGKDNKKDTATDTKKDTVKDTKKDTAKTQETTKKTSEQ